MNDREKVMWSLARCSCGVPDSCSDCNYDNYPPRICLQHLTGDALTLLKVQEPIVPIRCSAHAQGADDVWYECGKCGEFLGVNRYSKQFCSKCGRAVKWE